MSAGNDGAKISTSASKVSSGVLHGRVGHERFAVWAKMLLVQEEMFTELYNVIFFCLFKALWSSLCLCVLSKHRNSWFWVLKLHQYWDLLKTIASFTSSHCKVSLQKQRSRNTQDTQACDTKANLCLLITWWFKRRYYTTEEEEQRKRDS